MRCAWTLWTLLSWISAILCTIGCLLPHWLGGKLYYNPGTKNDPAFPSTLSLFRRCVYPVYLDSEFNADYMLESHPSDAHKLDFGVNTVPLVRIRSNCGHYEFEQIPHPLWRCGLILLILACASLYFLSFFLSLTACHSNLLGQLSIHRSCQAGLLFAGILVLLCCALFPIGWTGNPEVVQICGERLGRFDLGRCQLGWAYLITLVGGLLAILSAAIPNLCFPRSTSLLKPKQAKHHDSIQMHPNLKSTETCTTNLHLSQPRLHHLGYEPVWVKSPMPGFATPMIRSRDPSSVLLVRPTRAMPGPTESHSGYSQCTSNSIGGSSGEMDKKGLLTPPLVASPPNVKDQSSGGQVTCSSN